MLCSSCSKLSILPQDTRTCVKCQSIIPNNLSCICDTCSLQNHVCSVCLKKISTAPPAPKKRGCGCGAKK